MQALEFEPGLLGDLELSLWLPVMICDAIPQAVTTQSDDDHPMRRSSSLRPDCMPRDDPQRPHPPEDHAPLKDRVHSTGLPWNRTGMSIRFFSASHDTLC